MAMKVLEINGVKVEAVSRCDDVFRVGDCVKVKAKLFDGSYEVVNGAIVSVVDFKSRPAVVVACFKIDPYSRPGIFFRTIVGDDPCIEIARCGTSEWDNDVKMAIEQFKKVISEKEMELETLKERRDAFFTEVGIAIANQHN